MKKNKSNPEVKFPKCHKLAKRLAKIFVCELKGKSEDYCSKKIYKYLLHFLGLNKFENRGKGQRHGTRSVAPQFKIIYPPHDSALFNFIKLKLKEGQICNAKETPKPDSTKDKPVPERDSDPRAQSHSNIADLLNQRAEEPKKVKVSEEQAVEIVTSHPIYKMLLNNHHEVLMENKAMDNEINTLKNVLASRTKSDKLFDMFNYITYALTALALIGLCYHLFAPVVSKMF